MGKPSTGAWLTGEAARIDLSYLLKNGYIQRGATMKGSLEWSYRGSPTGSITLYSFYNDREAYLFLSYHIISRETGERENFDYRIEMERVPSNLGTGEVLYFLCPKTGKRCRILYRAYGWRTWASREAYQRAGLRLYYDGQKSSKKDYFNDRYWELEYKLDKLRKLRRTHAYRGKLTRRAQRVRRMTERQGEFDVLRWSRYGMGERLWLRMFAEDK